ncbi:hypothetical protein C2S53_003598 [Perilla frutescens var. hirtella]|uniref:Late embryogenesis abundant protein LEA-2 subgroup domain-containing protein n=1 Tax=Perilla frutescens var. hirtella TaxID=608512 RepID=A0AAD4IX42_PERFH|nr:hypothetical protein C2S53_003598 [Perilla frutescens var. hirtella]
MDPLSTSPTHTSPSIKQSKLSPLYQIVLPKQATPDMLLYSSKLRSREQAILRKPRTTSPMVWFAAILCMIFSLLLIFLGIAVLVVFLAVQPKTAAFDMPAASLSAVFVNFPEYINGDITLLANFSNPNRKLSVRYEYLKVELFFLESALATQVVQPFSQRPGNARLISIHMLSGLVYLPPNLATEFQKQVQRNRISYSIKGTFKVKIKLGLLHYSYWLHGDCQLEMTSPPNSMLITHNCKTKR